MPIDDFKDGQTDDGEYGYFDGPKLYSMAPSKEFLIENILYENDVICISSMPGVGKTMLALQMMCSLTSGTPFLGTYKVARPMNVLYIQSEGDRCETLERLQLMRKGVPLDDNRWAHVNIPGVSFNIPSEFTAFSNWVDTTPKTTCQLYDVIIIDPLYTTVSGSLKDDEVATNWVKHIRAWKAYHQCAVIILHHDAKDIYTQEGTVVDKGTNVSFGSVFWQAFFNHNFKLRKRDHVYTLEGGKQRSGKIVERISMTLNTPEPLMFVCTGTEGSTALLVIRRLIDGAPRAMMAKEIVAETDMGKSTVYRVLDSLEENKQVKVTMSTHGKLYSKKEF